MSHYLVVNADITDAERLADYVDAARPTLAGHPVTRLASTNTAETLEGTPAGSRVVILEFPDRGALLGWYNSPEYQAVIGMRLESTNGFALIVEGAAH